MKDKRPEYGIWGGRFQIIHKGHEYVLKYVDENYSHVCIGIVNPNPKEPPWDIKEHEKFEPLKNPFTYFQRMYLWDKLLRFHSIMDAVIVPHWHPRKSLALESTFLPLPKEKREWVIPCLPDEEFKIRDYEMAGEKVNILYEEPADLKKIHASEIKRLFDNNDSDFKADIPEKLQLITEKFLREDNWTEEFIIVPILNDKWAPILFCIGIQVSITNCKKLIFAPIVNVDVQAEWWKYQSLDMEVDKFTFYEKYEIINDIMKKVQFYDYLVTPIIVRNQRFQAINAFLPDSNSRIWLFIDGINTGRLFNQVRREKQVREFDITAVSNDIFLEICGVIIEWNEKFRYVVDDFKDDESEGNDQMSKYDFRGAKVIGDFNLAEQGGIYIDKRSRILENSDANSVIIDILNEKNVAELERLFKKADDMFENKPELEKREIIENIVKEHIDSAEKKNSFLQKLKRFTGDISKSIVAGILLQAIKNLIF